MIRNTTVEDDSKQAQRLWEAIFFIHHFITSPTTIAKLNANHKEVTLLSLQIFPVMLFAFRKKNLYRFVHGCIPQISCDLCSFPIACDFKLSVQCSITLKLQVLAHMTEKRGRINWRVVHVTHLRKQVDFNLLSKFAFDLLFTII